MEIYEFITPSDPITFKAENDKIAFIVSVIIGNGKAGCTNCETGRDVPSLIAFKKDPEEAMKTFLECDPAKFIEANREGLANSFLSFAYGDAESRKVFDEACAAIDDPDKLEKFKKGHENRNRSSMSEWVKFAWKQGDGMMKKLKQKTT